MHQPNAKPTTESSINTGALMRAAVLMALGLMAWIKFLDGSLNYYVHPRYNGLIAFTGAVMTVLGLIGILMTLGDKESDPDRDGRQFRHWLTIGILLIPLIFGLLIPARPLGVNAIQDSGTRAISGGSNLSSASAARLANLAQPDHTSDTRQWTMLEWSFALNEDTALIAYKNKPVDLEGFVYRPKNGVVKGGGQFYVARYIVICCTADSTGVSLPVLLGAATGTALPANDSWIHIQGHISQATGTSGGLVAVIAADTLTAIPQPRDPYLYP